jgi:hypothetical protein
MGNEKPFPKCQQQCEFPEGVFPYYNCDGPRQVVVGATDVTGLSEDLSAEDLETLGRPVDVRVCGNAALQGIDPLMAKRLKQVNKTLDTNNG